MNQRILIPLSALAILVVVIAVGSFTNARPVPAQVVVESQPVLYEEPGPTREELRLDAGMEMALMQKDATAERALHDATADTEAFSPENYQDTVARQLVSVEEDTKAVAVESAPKEKSAESADVVDPVEEKVDEVEERATQENKKPKHTPARQSQPEQEPEAQEVSTQSVTFTVVGGGTYTADVPAGSTVQAAMNAAGVPYTTKGFGGMGAYVTSVNGIVEDEQAGMYWILYIDGAPAGLGISAATVGTNMTWRLEKGW